MFSMHSENTAKKPIESRHNYLKIKRLFDICFSCASILFFLPLMLLVALAVKLSSKGSVIFKQTRVGKDNSRFKIFKFRTMKESAHGGVQVTGKGDPRITKLGAILRKTKLDELPQLFNVLRGDMSVVGPRPETPHFVKFYTKDDMQTLSIRPGLTDIATVSFRNEEELLTIKDDYEQYYIDVIMRRKLRFKKEYLKKASFLFDLELILLTVFKILLPGLVIFDTEELDRRVQYFLDIVLFASMLLLAYLVRFEGLPESPQFEKMLMLTPYVALMRFVFLFLSGAYVVPWRALRIDHLPLFAFATMIPSLIFLASRMFLPLSLNAVQLPYSVIAIEAVFSFSAIVGIRLLRRSVFMQRESAKIINPVLVPRSLIIGAGKSGQLIAKEIIDRRNPPFRILGFLDDDKSKQGSYILGFRVLGTIDDLTFNVERLHIEQVIIAVSHIRRSEIRRILKLARHTPVRLKIIPPQFEEIDGMLNLDQIWKIKVDDLLGRKQTSSDENRRSNEICKPVIYQKRVMITGAGGSIGSGLVKQVLAFKPKEVLLLDVDENALYKLGLELDRLAGQIKYKIIIGDIRDMHRMRKCFKDFMPHVLLHAAAYKHVPIMEQNPVQAIENNVLGTENLVELSESYEVERFVMLSTDKALNPVSIMGASKRLAELIVLGQKVGGKTLYSVVRFGNVIGTRGSVVPTFINQIEQNLPLTFTDKRASRFFMTVTQASSLVLLALGLSHKAETFVLYMGEPILIKDLADDLIFLMGRRRKSVNIEYRGLRAGERLHEIRLTDEPGMRETEFSKVFIAPSLPVDFLGIKRELSELKQLIRTGSDSELIEVLKRLPLDYKPQAEKPVSKAKVS